MSDLINVTIWNEFRHEKQNETVKAVYPDGIHVALANMLQERGFSAYTATLDEPEHGLPQSRLDATDVLLWWGHMAHDEVDEAIVKRVQNRVLDGMGLIVLHSGHFAKIFKWLLGTSCDLHWRDIGERERLWISEPGHPIANGLGTHIDIPKAEMYGEPFGIPSPDHTVFVSWFEGGEVFRSGVTYTRGRGRIFYFRPGHETFPIYYQAEVQQVIENAVRWAAPNPGASGIDQMHRPNSLEPIA